MHDVLPDILQEDLLVVFCGTAASTVSAREGAYYANASNAFWRTLYQTGMTPRRYAPGEFLRLLELRIGLTDVAKGVAGSDSSLRQSDFGPDCLSQKIRRFQPQIVAFTSKAAWRAWRRLSAADAVSYGRQLESLGPTEFVVLPSPSGAARGYWDLSYWQALADDYRRRMRLL
ncbi:MAG: mismatch-specific DNA-glycosylase [Anaerolineae bacterium]|nr:mismatch-specific DNA-glycosylase [Anaerolineae bacterium]